MIRSLPAVFTAFPCDHVVTVHLIRPPLSRLILQGKTIDDLSPDAIRDAAQWCKAGSIEGCKLPTAVIIYTPWSNLRKDGSMAPGQASRSWQRSPWSAVYLPERCIVAEQLILRCTASGWPLRGIRPVTSLLPRALSLPPSLLSRCCCPLQVSFHSDKPIRKYTVLERDRETLRRLEKSKEEKYPDLAAERKRRGECAPGALLMLLLLQPRPCFRPFASRLWPVACVSGLLVLAVQTTKSALA